MVPGLTRHVQIAADVGPVHERHGGVSGPAFEGRAAQEPVADGLQERLPGAGLEVLGGLGPVEGCGRRRMDAGVADASARVLEPVDRACGRDDAVHHPRPVGGQGSASILDALRSRVAHDRDVLQVVVHLLGRAGRVLDPRFSRTAQRQGEFLHGRHSVKHFRVPSSLEILGKM